MLFPVYTFCFKEIDKSSIIQEYVKYVLFKNGNNMDTHIHAIQAEKQHSLHLTSSCAPLKLYRSPYSTKNNFLLIFALIIPSAFFSSVSHLCLILK